MERRWPVLIRSNSAFKIIALLSDFQQPLLLTTVDSLPSSFRRAGPNACHVSRSVKR